MKFAFFMAMRYLRMSRGFTRVMMWCSALGIFLGVATLVVVMSVMNGFRHELLNRLLGVNSHVNVYASHLTHNDAERVQQHIQNVSFSALFGEHQVLLAHAGNSSGVLVRCMHYERFMQRPFMRQNLSIATSSTPPDNWIILGERLAKTLNIQIGQSIQMLIPNAQMSAFGMTPRVRTFHVHNIFNVGMFEYDSALAFISDEHAKALWHQKALQGIEIFLHNPEMHLAQFQMQLPSIFPNRFVRAVNWQQSHASFFNALQTERTVMFLILSLIVIVATFNIVSGLVMLVKDKTQDIAILRTIGALRGTIVQCFLTLGCLIGSASTLCGICGGLLFSSYIEPLRNFMQEYWSITLFPADVYFLTHIPVKIHTDDLMWIAIVACILSFCASIYPAYRAANLNPVDGLRHA